VSLEEEEDFMWTKERRKKFSFYKIQNMVPKKGRHFLIIGQSQLAKKGKMD